MWKKTRIKIGQAHFKRDGQHNGIRPYPKEKPIPQDVEKYDYNYTLNVKVCETNIEQQTICTSQLNGMDCNGFTS